MKLRDTVKYMNSHDYKRRFIAEYLQLDIRLQKLETTIAKAERGELPFHLSCPIDLLKKQADIMSSYKEVLITRAEIEGVDLSGKD